MAVPPPDPGHLADFEAIKQLKAAYFRCIDDQATAASLMPGR